MAKKFSDVFSSIKYAKMQAKHDKGHVGGSTDDEEHGAVSSTEFNQQVQHAKKRSMTEDEEYTQEQIEEAIDHIITARQIIGHAKKTPGGNHEYMKFLKSLRDKFGKEYSTNVHQTASKLATEEVEQLDEISKSTLDSYIHKSFAAGNALHRQIEKETDPAKKAELKAKLSKRNTGVITSAKKLRSEEVEQLDEVSLDKARDVHKARFSNWEKAKKTGDKEEIQKAQGKMVKAFGYVKSKDSKEMKKIANKLPKSPEERNKMHSDRYDYNKKMGYSNESVEVTEAEKMKGNDPCWKNYQMVGTKKKNGKEVPNCVPVNESRAADIVREAYAKGKKNKKDESIDKDVSGKVEKFEADPQLTDTIQKQ